jgi:two-component system, chemotaxis family, protein-glutamate methylesterase/glutaminase
MSLISAARPLRDVAESPVRRPATTFVTRRFPVLTPRAIVIGASTGGPQALGTLLQGLAPSIAYVPVLVVLHMPANFTQVVSSHIERLTGLPTRASKHGETLKPGHIYFAPGDLHLKITKIGGTSIVCHSDAGPENFCKPAVDVLFRTAALTYGPGLLGIVLTGMGSDGLAGSRAIVEAGGAIIAQDEASSVVWGMPGAVAQEGLCSAVTPIDTMASLVAGLLRGQKPGVVK